MPRKQTSLPVSASAVTFSWSFLLRQTPVWQWQQRSPPYLTRLSGESMRARCVIYRLFHFSYHHSLNTRAKEQKEEKLARSVKIRQPKWRLSETQTEKTTLALTSDKVDLFPPFVTLLPCWTLMIHYELNTFFFYCIEERCKFQRLYLSILH